MWRRDVGSLEATKVAHVLQDGNNMKELIAFLNEVFVQAVHGDVDVYVSDRENVLCYPAAAYMNYQSPFQHGELTHESLPIQLMQQVMAITTS